VQVLFVPGNRSHVATFLPVADELVCRSHEASFLVRDSLVDHEYRVKDLLVSPTLPVREYTGNYNSDMRRLFPAVSSYGRFKREFRRFLAGERFDVLVTSNDDSVMFDRLAVFEARKRGVLTLLIQESVRPTHRRVPISRVLSDAGTQELRGEVAQVVARVLCLGPFFRKGYGHGGCALIAAAGAAFKEQLVDEGVPSASITITGQPRLDFQVCSASRPHPDPQGRAPLTVVFCNQPLLCRQEPQDRLFVSLVRACAVLPRVRLHFRPHPRDLPDSHWLGLLPKDIDRERVLVSRAGKLSELLCEADAMLTVASTTALEAMAAGVPVGLVNYLPTSWCLAYDRFEAAVAIDSEAALGPAIETLLFDRTMRVRCRKNAPTVLEHELHLRDGYSPRRIVDLLEQQLAR
jgi:hypothetical protein